MGVRQVRTRNPSLEVVCDGGAERLWQHFLRRALDAFKDDALQQGRDSMKAKCAIEFDFEFNIENGTLHIDAKLAKAEVPGPKRVAGVARLKQDASGFLVDIDDEQLVLPTDRS